MTWVVELSYPYVVKTILTKEVRGQSPKKVVARTMARFKPNSETMNSTVSLNKKLERKRVPFRNVYASVEEDMIYVNMEAVPDLKVEMECLRDIALIIDISGSMHPYYVNGEVEMLTAQIVDSLASFDDDGIDLLFFSNGLVYEATVANASEVKQAVHMALQSKGRYSTTMPTQAFSHFCEQIKKKGRAGTVLFLTDGVMDDGGRELKNFYQNVLHREFKTRDNFYCYAIEFGRSAFGALKVLDGLYEPEQGPEDLFDMESASNLVAIADVLSQVAGMNAIGSNEVVKATVGGGALMDMVNTDFIEGGTSELQGPINQIMSFRVRTRTPFVLTLTMSGYEPMKIQVSPRGIEADVDIL